MQNFKREYLGSFSREGFELIKGGTLNSGGLGLITRGATFIRRGCGLTKIGKLKITVLARK